MLGHQLWHSDHDVGWCWWCHTATSPCVVLCCHAGSCHQGVTVKSPGEICCHVSSDLILSLFSWCIGEWSRLGVCVCMMFLAAGRCPVPEVVLRRHQHHLVVKRRWVRCHLVENQSICTETLPVTSVLPAHQLIHRSTQSLWSRSLVSSLLGKSLAA